LKLRPLALLQFPRRVTHSLPAQAAAKTKTNEVNIVEK